MTSEPNSAAVDRVRAYVEREYVATLNAILASPDENADIQRWRGRAEALRQVAEQCCRETAADVPAYRSDEWRHAHGVYTPEQVAQWARSQHLVLTAYPTVR